MRRLQKKREKNLIFFHSWVAISICSNNFFLHPMKGSYFAQVKRVLRQYFQKLLFLFSCVTFPLSCLLVSHPPTFWMHLPVYIQTMYICNADFCCCMVTIFFLQCLEFGWCLKNSINLVADFAASFCAAHKKEVAIVEDIGGHFSAFHCIQITSWSASFSSLTYENLIILLCTYCSFIW